MGGGVQFSLWRYSLVNVGLIGCGAYGGYHASIIKDHGLANMVGFCDRHIDRAIDYQDKYGTMSNTFYTEYPQELIEHQDIDIVWIATHHDSHAGFCVDAANNGKHIFVEKPLALTTQECIDVVDAVGKAGVKCAVGYKFRYSKVIASIIDSYDAPQLLIGSVIDHRWSDRYWATLPVVGGGNVMSQGCHMADMVCYIAQSTPVRVYGEAANLNHPPGGCIDHMVSTILFENGSMASISYCDSGKPGPLSKWVLSVHGHGTSIDIYNRFLTASVRGGQIFKHGGDDLVYLEDVAFIDSVGGNGRILCNEVQGAMVTNIMESCVKSALMGEGINID